MMSSITGSRLGDGTHDVSILMATDRIVQALAGRGVTVGRIYENGRQIASVRRG